MKRIAELLILIPTIAKQVEELQAIAWNKKNTQLKRVNEFFQNLLGLSADVLKVSLSDHSTQIHIQTSEDWNTHCEFSIRHPYSTLRDDKGFGLSWLSTSGCTEDTPHYLVYLTALGKVGDDFMNAKTVVPFLKEEIATHEAIFRERRDKSTELDSLKRELKRLQDEELLNTVYDNNGIDMTKQFPDGYGVYSRLMKGKTLALTGLRILRVTEKTVLVRFGTKWDDTPINKTLKKRDADELFTQLAQANKQEAEKEIEEA